MEAPLLPISQQLTRHGDRAPVQSYPLDPYKDFPWPGGYGALSPVLIRVTRGVSFHIKINH